LLKGQPPIRAAAVPGVGVPQLSAGGLQSCRAKGSALTAAAGVQLGGVVCYNRIDPGKPT